jgi:hypothetical protein
LLAFGPKFALWVQDAIEFQLAARVGFGIALEEAPAIQSFDSEGVVDGDAMPGEG